MSATDFVKFVLGSIGAMFIFFAVLSVFATVLSIIIGLLLFSLTLLMMFGVVIFGLAYVNRFVNQRSSAESDGSNNQQTMNQQERIDRVKEDYLENKITEREFEKKLDKILGKSRRKSISLNIQRNREK